MSCGSLCASIQRNILQNCINFSPVATFDLAAGGTVTFDDVYQADGGFVTASGVISVVGSGAGLSPLTVVTLTFQRAAATVGTITFTNVISGNTYGFTELVSFDNIDITVDNNDAIATSTGSINMSLVVNA